MSVTAMRQMVEVGSVENIYEVEFEARRVIEAG
jgi:hypothetical protein